MLIKYFSLLIFICVTFVVNAQHHFQKPRPKPLLILDSIIIGTDPAGISNPDEIKEVYVDKDYSDSINNIRGRVIITTKNPGKYNFLSLANIAHNRGIKTYSHTIYMVNEKFITDTTYYKLDANNLLSVEEENVKFGYLKHQNIHLVKILTNTKKNQEIMKIIAEEKKTISVRANNIRTNYDQSSTW